MLVIKIKFSFSKPEIYNPHAASYLSGVVTQNCGRRRPIALVSLVNTKGWKNSLTLQLEKKHAFPPHTYWQTSKKQAAYIYPYNAFSKE